MRAGLVCHRCLSSLRLSWAGPTDVRLCPQNPSPTHLPILVPQEQQHWPTAAFHVPVQAPQAEAVPPSTENEPPGVAGDSCGEMEAELGAGLEVGEGVLPRRPPSTITSGTQKDWAQHRPTGRCLTISRNFLPIGNSPWKQEFFFPFYR